MHARPSFFSGLLSAPAAVALTLWVGGMVFFAVGVAPNAFSVLPDRVMAGNVISASMRTLHLLQYGCGGLLCLLYTVQVARGGRFGSLRLFTAFAMLAIALYSGFAVAPELATLRAIPGGLDALTPDLHARFDTLHVLSVRLLGANILMGLALTVLERFSNDKAPLEERGEKGDTWADDD